MRLRTRLALAFVLLAVAPLVLVVPFALENLRRTLTAELGARLDGAQAAAQTELGRTGTEAERAIEELAESVALEDIARDIHAQAAPGRLASAAGRLMRGRGLTVLSLFDSNGTTLSSGHLPARLGDKDEALFAIARAGAKGSVPVLVEVRDESGVRRVPALVAARPLDYGELRIWAVGGTLLDAPLAEHLARLVGARVEILSSDGPVASAGTAESPVAERWVELSPAVRVRVELSQAAFRTAERGIARAFGLLVALGLSCAILLGLFVSNRITRPVEALTRAARRVASGQLDARVETVASGEVGELVSTFNRMTSELREATERLVASERVAAWQEVARRLAHEIKNPLTPIKMSLETLVEAQRSQSPRFEGLFQESAGAVLEEVERLRRIVDEFSRFARLPKPELSALDLGELVTQVLTLYAAPPAGIELTQEIAPGIRIEADRDQLTQVLVNLVKNAVEAMPGGGWVRVSVRRREGEALLEVSDSGPGLKPDERKRIFEPYFTTKAGGTGLGLAIAARIAQEHGGRLEAGGAPGQGAVFTLVLPVKPGP